MSMREQLIREFQNWYRDSGWVSNASYEFMADRILAIVREGLPKSKSRAGCYCSSKYCDCGYIEDGGYNQALTDVIAKLEEK